MKVLNFIYIILTIIALLYIMISRNKMDFLVIYYFSSVIYYFPVYFGKVYYSVLELPIKYLPIQEIDSLTYIVLIINMINIIMWLFIRSYIYREKNLNYLRTLDSEIKQSSTNDRVVFILTIIGFIMMIYTIYHYRQVLFRNSSFNKAVILDRNNFISSYFKSISLFLFVYSFINDSNKYIFITRILSTTFLLLIFRLGHRSYIVIGCLSIIFYYICKTSTSELNLIQYVIKHKKVVILSLILIFVTFSIKNITRALFNRNFDVVLNRLTDLDYYLNTFKLSEPNTITLNLNSILSNQFVTNINTYIIVPFMIIPGIARLIDIPSFNSLFQNELFPEANFNVASTYIGEAMANGGILVFFLILNTLILLLMLIDYKSKVTNNSIERCFLILAGIDLSFYIHRNSLEFAISRIRIYLYICILLYIFKLIIKILSGKRINN